MRKTKLPRKQKAANGLHQVSVPPPGTGASVLTSGLSGASAGSALGPYGALAGGAFGLAQGIFQKGEMDKANQEAVKHNQFVKANEAVEGVDPTYTQRGQYALGTGEVDAHKPIEVEKDELVFRKVGDKFRLKADFRKGKPHEKGGEDYLAQEGDIIFPGKQRGKVLAAYKQGQHTKLEGMRLHLPKDTNPQGEAALGLDSVDPRTGRYTDAYNQNGAYGAATNALNRGTYLAPFDPANPYQGEGVNAYQAPGQPKPSYYLNSQGISPLQPNSPFGKGMGAAPQIPSTLAPIPQQTTYTLPASPEAAVGMENTPSAGMGNALKYASVANNLIQGFSSPEKVNESYLTPTLMGYQDRSDPLRQQSRMAATAQAATARTTSGGNTGNLRANQQAAAVGDYTRRQGIDNAEQGRADRVQEYNTQERGRVKGVNLDLKNQYQDLNDRNRAARDNQRTAGFDQLTGVGNAQEQEAYLRSRDTKLDGYNDTYLKLLNNQNMYQIDKQGNQTGFNPSGSSIIPTRQTRRYDDYETEVTDAEGNVKTTRKRTIPTFPKMR